MEKIEVHLIALSSSESSPGNYAAVLESPETKKRMAIIIGATEAQAIAVYLERMQLPRPLTHDIFKTTIIEMGGRLKEVVIYMIENNMFHAWLVIETAQKEEKKIDARASDALAMSIRFACPLYVAATVMEEAVITDTLKKLNLIKGSLADYSISELESLLQNVLAKEDYESAGRIRDMINRQKGKQ